jgi:hypothetical protein
MYKSAGSTGGQPGGPSGEQPGGPAGDGHAAGGDSKPKDNVVDAEFVDVDDKK